MTVGSASLKTIVSPDLDCYLTGTLANIETGKKGQATVDVTRVGVKAEVGMRIGKTWSVSAVAAKPWKGPAEVGARLRASW